MIKHAAAISFIIFFLVYVVVEVNDKPRVLVVHSYNPFDSWTARVSQGIERELSDEYFSVRWHYMDTKPENRDVKDAEMKRAGKSAIKLIEKWMPHVVIAVDDNAQKYVGKSLAKEYGPGNTDENEIIEIVYAGVNGPAELYYGQNIPPNVRGILERRPLGLIKQSILEMFESNPTSPLVMYYITDASTTSKGNTSFIRSYEGWKPEIELRVFVKAAGDSIGAVRAEEATEQTFFYADSFTEWQSMVKYANDNDADLILINGYKKLKDAVTVDAGTLIADKKRVVRWTESRVTVPVIGFSTSYVKDCGYIGFGASPYEQGEAAAEITKEILNSSSEEAKAENRTGQLFLFYLRASVDTVYKDQIKAPMLLKTFAKTTAETYFADDSNCSDDPSDM